MALTSLLIRSIHWNLQWMKHSTSSRAFDLFLHLLIGINCFIHSCVDSNIQSYTYRFILPACFHFNLPMYGLYISLNLLAKKMWHILLNIQQLHALYMHLWEEMILMPLLMTATLPLSQKTMGSIVHAIESIRLCWLR